MNQYGSIYFLHIPKTGGRYFRDIILRSFETKIKINPSAKGHPGWNEKINQSTYIISIFREPIEYLCSFYNFFKKDNNWTNFFSFINNFSNQNIQSKFIVNSSNKHQEVFNQLNKKIDLYLLNQRLNKINFLIDNKQLQSDPQNILNKISQDLNFEKIQIINKKSQYDKRSSDTINLYNSLTKKQINEILKLNYLDYQIYSQINDKIFKVN